MWYEEIRVAGKGATWAEDMCKADGMNLRLSQALEAWCGSSGGEGGGLRLVLDRNNVASGGEDGAEDTLAMYAL